MRNYKSLNRLLSLMLAVILVMAAAVVPVSAATEGDIYIYNRDKHRVPGETSSYYFFYQSPCTFSYISPKYPGGSFFHQVWIFDMYNTNTDEHIPTYCTDVDVTATIGANYRLMNLEDSPFSGSAAGQIRRILTEGFYIIPIDGESESDHAARVAARTKTLGEDAGVPDLTTGEAISATQYAIWQVAHGSSLTITDFCQRVMSYLNSTRYESLCSLDELEAMKNDAEKGLGHIGGRIQKVYKYLLSLPPIEASSMMVGPSSFVELHDPVKVKNDDGTYTVTVTATVKVEMAAEDELTLKANLGGKYSQNVTLSSTTQTQTFTFTNVPADYAYGDVKLSISGTQTVKGYYYFDADGERDASQSMVAYEDSQVPVYAEVVAKENRGLTIKKTNALTGKALQGIVFDIYPVEANADDYKVPTTLAPYSLITDAKGEASIDFTQQGQADGRYLIVEREHPSIVAPLEPFYVNVPHYDTEKQEYVYDVKIKAKNTVKETIGIEKDVISIGQDEASVDAYAPHTWIIGTTVPEDISSGEYYVITDTLDNRLDYIEMVRVALETYEVQENLEDTIVYELVPDTDYTLTVTDENSLAEGKPSDSFKIELTSEGRSKLAAAIGTNKFSDYMLRVYFNAQINANADVATEIPNQANVKYKNSVGTEFDKKSDIPKVYTGGINLLKVDAVTQTVLPGAIFEVYRPATQDEIDAKDPNVETLVDADDNKIKAVKISFHDNAEMTGDKVPSVTSGEDGKIAIYGLAYGRYYLKEIQAPPGYNTLTAVVKLDIDDESHLEENMDRIENKSGALLPATGGIGTTIFTASGIGLVCIACLFLYMNKRKMIET